MEHIFRTSLIKMLEAFAAPVNEEEAWALCHQGATYLSHQHLQHKLALTNATDCFFTNYNIDEIRSIEVTKNGEVTLGTKETEKPTTEYEQVCSLGVLVYQALDYGLDLSEKQVTSTEFEHLIARMTGCDDDSDNDNESANDTNTSPMTFSDVLEVCSEHVKAPLDAASYYANILKSLVSLYQELQGYIAKAEDSHSFEEIKYQENFEEEKSKYKQIWEDIMQEIQRGKVLKRVPLRLKKSNSFDKAVAEIKCQKFKFRKSKDENWNKIMTEINRGVTLRKVATPLQQPVVENQVWKQLMAELQRGVFLKKVQHRLQDDENPFEICVADIQRQKSKLCHTERQVRPLQPSELSPRELLLAQIRNKRPRLSHVLAGQEEIRSTSDAGEGGALPVTLSIKTSQNVTYNKGMQNCVSDFGSVEDHKGSSSFQKTQLKDENAVETLQQSSSKPQKLFDSSLEEWENESDQTIQNESGNKTVDDQLSCNTSFEPPRLQATHSPEESLTSCEIYNHDRVRSGRLYLLSKKQTRRTQKKVSSCCFDANGRPVENPSESVVVKPRRAITNKPKRPNILNAFIQKTSLRQKTSPLQEGDSGLVLNWSTIQHMKVIINLRGMCFISLLYIGNVFSYDFLSLATVFYISLVSGCSTPRLAVLVLIFLLLELWFIHG